MGGLRSSGRSAAASAVSPSGGRAHGNGNEHPETGCGGELESASRRLIGLSPRTVETYRLRLMKKLDLDNLPALVRYAIRHGIVGLE